MFDPVTTRPTICLNMIVRNDAHIVEEALDSIAPYITSWVIVDTDSDDGTGDVVENHMAGLGIPGQLYKRRWRNFGHNRTEALHLAQGCGDYIWVMGADDTLLGTPDLIGLTAGVYRVRRKHGSSVYWRPELFRSGVRARWVGVTHEYATWDISASDADLLGDYHVEQRGIESSDSTAQKLASDRDLLLAEVERNPADARSVFYLAQSYRDLGDHANARQWYTRRVELAGWDQEVFFAMYQVAQAMANLGEPWPDVQDAYLRAWEFQATRAEPLYAIATQYRRGQRYRLGHLFAESAAEIVCPEQGLFVQSDVYAWRAADEQAICASWIGAHAQAFVLCRSLLARADIPDEDRQRIATNRDFSVPAILDAVSVCPEVVAGRLVACDRDAEVTVSLVAGPDRSISERTLNSFLQCCSDIERVGRFLVLDTGLSAADRAVLAQQYRFVEFIDTDADAAGLPEDDLARIRAEVRGRYLLHLGSGWRFFAPEAYVSRLSAVLAAEPDVYQVGVNFADADELTGSCAAEQLVRRTAGAGRYVLADTVIMGPAMYDTTRVNPVAAQRTATLDEVLCVRGGDSPQQSDARAEATVPPEIFRPSGGVPDREFLLAEVQRNPGDGLSMLQLAQSYFDGGGWADALAWYGRRIELGGDGQDVFYAMLLAAECTANLGKPWPDVQDAYLRAWEFRPTRAEPLYALARRYRSERRWWPAYLFAKAAARIRYPVQDSLVMADIYDWRALDEQAGCAHWVGKPVEAFALCRQLIAHSNIPDEDRRRIAKNRDSSVLALLDAASAYSAELVGNLWPGQRDAEVTVTVVAGPDRTMTEQTVNSFLRCCTDVSRVGRFVVLDTGMVAADRAELARRYRFAEFVDADHESVPAADLAQLRAQIGGRYWLHLDVGWRFFAPDSYITRLTGVLAAEEQVYAVGVNFADADTLIGNCAPEHAARRAPGAGRYVITDTPPSGPVMVDTARLDRPERLRAATLDEVLAIVTDRSLRQQRG